MLNTQHFHQCFVHTGLNDIEHLVLFMKRARDLLGNRSYLTATDVGNSQEPLVVFRPMQVTFPKGPQEWVWVPYYAASSSSFSPLVLSRDNILAALGGTLRIGLSNN